MIDANLSPRLVDLLAGEFSDLTHVLWLQGIAEDDRLIWDHARRHGMIIVTKDSDFNAMSLLRGAPPKIIWLRVGNSSTRLIADLILRRRVEIAEFHDDHAANLLVLGKHL